MICQPCRDGVHPYCPEAERQRDQGLTAIERAASDWCDCQHKPPAPGKP